MELWQFLGSLHRFAVESDTVCANVHREIPPAHVQVQFAGVQGNTPSCGIFGIDANALGHQPQHETARFKVGQKAFYYLFGIGRVGAVEGQRGYVHE